MGNDRTSEGTLCASEEEPSQLPVLLPCRPWNSSPQLDLSLSLSLSLTLLYSLSIHARATRSGRGTPVMGLVYDRVLSGGVFYGRGTL